MFCETVEGCYLPQDTIDGLIQLFYDHKDTFATSSADLGFCNILKHDIDTGDARPIKKSPRWPPLAARDAEDEILDDMLATAVIEPSTSSWASPVCLVKKKDGQFRFCIDYRCVNAVSKTDSYPMPDIQDALDHLRGANILPHLIYSQDIGRWASPKGQKKDLLFVLDTDYFISQECPLVYLGH